MELVTGVQTCALPISNYAECSRISHLQIRNSTAEFLIFQIEGKEDGVQVVYKDESVWATQKAIAELFDVGVPAISKHLKKYI